LAPALLSLSSGQDGTRQMTLRLSPAELGTVQVRIDRTVDGPASVAITADRPDTLEMLRQDQPALQRMLDQAGVPTEGRTLSFHAAGVTAPFGGGSADGGGSPSGKDPSSQSGGSQTGASQSGSSRSGSSHSGYSQSGAGGGSGFAPREQAFHGSRRAAAANAQTAASDQTPASKWLRAGLDITA
jgi:hypothetical protein